MVTSTYQRIHVDVQRYCRSSKLNSYSSFRDGSWGVHNIWSGSAQCCSCEASTGEGLRIVRLTQYTNVNCPVPHVKLAWDMNQPIIWEVRKLHQFLAMKALVSLEVVGKGSRKPQETTTEEKFNSTFRRNQQLSFVTNSGSS